ncbi:MAG: hypothetical protein CVU39_09565 [Chloroflexi bacterium HGW-Chloroflexi-10]|nr:MAG: hypothetical protein CVU39_09565 [Chloroflexi bacterium HGW-Chloroflexi-10]
MTSLFHTLNVSKQDMLSRLLDLDVVSNNLANVNTIGYKATRGNFQELLAAASQKNGAILSSTQALMQQGSLSTTGNFMDWAIQGEGFFAVRLEDGTTAYTRDGHFMLDANNTLVNGSGQPLVWNGTLPTGTTAVSVDSGGGVVALVNDEWQNVGTMQLTRFANPTGLSAFGQNLWLPNESSGAAQAGTPGQNGYGIVRSQTLEQSNVDLSQEMTRLMTLQRAFQMSTKVFQQTDTMINQAINLRKY